MPNSLTEEALKNVKCYDYSVQQWSNGKDVLILMCEDVEGRNQLNEILNSHPFDLKVFIDEKKGNYELHFDFIETDLFFSLKTGRNEKTYPPVTLLRDQKVKFITTGVWGDDSEKGRMCEYHSNLLRLGKLEMAEALQHAASVQFYGNHDETQPSAVALIFNDWNHLLSAEADEAYNLLEDRCNSMPKLEIKTNLNKTVDLRIWDILIDLDIRLINLPYSEDELEKFVSKAKPDHSFAFVLGLPAQGKGDLGIAPTKREGFSMITLRGYVFKK